MPIPENNHVQFELGTNFAAWGPQDLRSPSARLPQTEASRRIDFSETFLRTVAMSIDGAALVERIRNGANRQFTLIVVRENLLKQAPGVVHGFAGNHHPTLPPPTLRVR